MGIANYLRVNGRDVLSTKITYDDLLWLYRDFEKKNGRLPVTAEGLSKNNLPQGRIVKRVVEKNNKTYNEFMLELGKVSHVRTENKNYDLFLEKYKDICIKQGKALMIGDLVNNEFGLPSAGWFVKYCPNENVKSYNDFVEWCGFENNSLRKDNIVVANTLINLEETLNRPITRKDISEDAIGFSMIVVQRIWGSLSKAKKELGLMSTLHMQPKPFEYYKEKLDKTLDNIYRFEHRKFVAWSDIENNTYSDEYSNHKTYLKAFQRQGIDFFSYIKSKGFDMFPSSMGNTYIFDDGEKTKSIFEYDFSNFLRKELGLIYNRDYFRDVMYKNFLNTDKKSKMNCDYQIFFNGEIYYIEIAGIIQPSLTDDWRIRKYASNRENQYRDKMIQKEFLLKHNNKNYLFIFPRYMINKKYKDAVRELLCISKLEQEVS